MGEVRQLEGTEVFRPADDNHRSRRSLAPTGIRLSALEQAGVFYIAHRGGDQIFPENTLTAFDEVISAGAEVIETDCHLLADGGLGLMHDATVDRTTTSSGNISSLTSAQVDALVCDTDNWFHPSMYGNLSVPRYNTYLSRYRHSALMMVEVKVSAAAQPMADMISSMGMIQNSWVISFVKADLTPFANIGCETAFIDTDGINPSTSLPYTLAAISPARWLFVDRASVADATITTLIANGIKVGVYTINSHRVRDTYLALGVHAIISGDPIYAQATSLIAPHRTLTDPFAEKIRFHGYRTRTSSNTTFNAAFPGTDRIGIDGSVATTNAFIAMNWACPLPSTTYTLLASITYDTIQSASALGAIAFSCMDDREFAQTASLNVDGYYARLQTDGTFRLFRMNADGTNVQIGTNQAAGAILAGESRVMRVVVAAGSLLCEVRTADGLTVLASVSSSNADATAYRGRYLHAGRGNGTTQQVSFSRMSIAA